jgi:hypothetical protein
MPPKEIAPYSIAWPLVLLALSTLVYLLLDMFLLSKRFREIFQSVAFYLLWLLYTVLALVAYGAIRVSSWEKINQFVEQPQIAETLLLILSVLAALTVVPSFSLKLSDFKVIDIGQLIDRFRTAVYDSINDKVLENRKSSGQDIAQKLAVKFENQAQTLRDELGSLLQLSGVTQADITTRLENLRDFATKTGISEVRAFANSIVLQDPVRAKSLV